MDGMGEGGSETGLGAEGEKNSRIALFGVVRGGGSVRFLADGGITEIAVIEEVFDAAENGPAIVDGPGDGGVDADEGFESFRFPDAVVVEFAHGSGIVKAG